MKLTRARLEFKPEDLWVGIFWKHTYAKTDDGDKPMFTDVWICLLPCVPIHLTFFRKFDIRFQEEPRRVTSTGRVIRNTEQTRNMDLPHPPETKL